MSDVSIKTIKELHNFGVTGKGIKVAIIDSSFAKANDKLKIKQTINLDNNVRYSDHATACASIIKSSEFGIAPDCEIYSLALTNKGVTVESAKELANYIMWCVDNSIDIISISMGFGENIECHELLEACMYADKAGITIVAGAGNNGNEADKDHSYIIIPASYDYTICISNVDKNTNKIAKLSSTGYGIDFAGYGDGNKAYNVKGETYIFAGTSSATPYVAGCIALIKQQLPELNRLEVYEILKENAVKLDDKEKSLQYGYGLVKPLLISKDYKYKKREFLEHKFLTKNIYFENSFVDLEIKKDMIPKLIYTPNDNDKSFTGFKSSNPAYVTVDSQKGSIRAIGKGTSTITATIGNGRIAQLYVNVIDPNENIKTDADEKNKILEELGVYKVWDKGFKGEGINVGFIGFGCIDTDKINVKGRYSPKTKSLECFGGVGTKISSLISGIKTGIAPNCNYYVLNPSEGSSSRASMKTMPDCAEWAIKNKMDILFVRAMEDTTSGEKAFFKVNRPSHIKNLLDRMCANNIIVVDFIDDYFGNDHKKSTIITSDKALKISYVTDKKEFPSEKEIMPTQSPFIDCVGYGYGMETINALNEIETITADDITSSSMGEYYAAAQICGILALLRQQNPELKTAQDVRKILPQICKPLFGGKNDKTGYGLLRAEI